MTFQTQTWTKAKAVFRWLQGSSTVTAYSSAAFHISPQHTPANQTPVCLCTALKLVMSEGLHSILLKSYFSQDIIFFLSEPGINTAAPRQPLGSVPSARLYEFRAVVLLQETDFRSWNSPLPTSFAPWEPAMQIMNDPGEQTSRKVDHDQLTFLPLYFFFISTKGKQLY